MTGAPRRRAGRMSVLDTKDVSPQVAKLTWAERLDILDAGRRQQRRPDDGRLHRERIG